MNKLFSLAILYLCFAVPVSLGQTLSPTAQVSLITVEPGEELYSSFGHTAIRFYDPMRSMDREYGYGQFDFRTDNFYVKFLRGTLPYQIGADDMYSLLYGAQYENRTVREQVLNLSPTEKQRLFDALETNLLPQNREYRYKFYFDNCATRPRDMIAKACGDSLRFPTAVDTTKSYRDWMNDYLGEKPWAQLGMNLALGTPADQRANAWQAMYIPNNVYKQFDAARIRQAGGQEAPLVRNDNVLFQAAKTFRQQVPLWLDPNFVFAVFGVLIALVTVRRYQVGRIDGWLDKWLFGIAGFLGWFLFLLWVATDHGVTAWNPTLLWLMPLHLPLVFWALRPGHPRRRVLYFTATGLLILLGLYLSNVPGGADTLLGLTLLVRCLVNLSVARKPTYLPAQMSA